MLGSSALDRALSAAAGLSAETDVSGRSRQWIPRRTRLFLATMSVPTSVFSTQLVNGTLIGPGATEQRDYRCLTMHRLGRTPVSGKDAIIHYTLAEIPPTMFYSVR